MSLSRCPSGDASTELQFAISEPTPGVQNSCPQDAFAVALDLCFLTPSKQGCVPLRPPDPSGHPPHPISPRVGTLLPSLVR